jgi:hypothetical protein
MITRVLSPTGGLHPRPARRVLLRRDGTATPHYITEVNGSTLVGHYTSRYKTFDGLLVATRRRVFRRNPDNTVNLNRPAITLDIHDVELVHSRDEQDTDEQAPS